MDDSGYQITPADCEFLHLTPQAIADWVHRLAPLGMDHTQFEYFRHEIFDALHADGFQSSDVDVRLLGSSSNFFSGIHKRLPTADEITNPESLDRYHEWRGDATTHPVRRPFDSMYQLRLDPDPSDYDMHFSSDAMLARADEVRLALYPDKPLINEKYGFIDKTIARAAFPELYARAKELSQTLGREVTPAVFGGDGPPDKTALGGPSTHFRDTDWVLTDPAQPITAMRIPESGFQPYGRADAAATEVEASGRRALSELLHWLPVRGSLADVTVSVHSAPPDVDPRREGAVAWSVPVDAHGVPVDGKVPPEGGGYRIEISDHIADVNIPRAVAHEVAEISALRVREAAGLDLTAPDSLRRGAHPYGAELSPHDLGRLAEAEVLTRMLDDPATADYARSELAHLRDHLGLAEGERGADGRRELIDGELSPEAREALLGDRAVDHAPARSTVDHTRSIVDDSAAPPRAHSALAVPETVDRASAPFGNRMAYADDVYHAAAMGFDRAIGVHFFNDPDALAITRDAVTRIQNALTVLLHSHYPTWDRARIDMEIDKAFFMDREWGSAGQVGRGVTLPELLAEGNVRELMTAVYNASFANRHEHTLANEVDWAMSEGRAAAEQAGIAVPMLDRVAEHSAKLSDSLLDIGDLAKHSADPERNLAETYDSRAGRDPRPREVQQAMASTPRRYADMGAGLGKFERAYLEQWARETHGQELTDETQLPWREGAVYHSIGPSDWVTERGELGFVTVDGVSGTTMRMLEMGRVLGFDDVHSERFLNALMGWMLPGPDHSLYEILRGADILGLHQPVDATAAEMYEHVRGMPPGTVRAIAPDGLLPTEAAYEQRAAHDFSEVGPRVRRIADRLMPELRSGVVTDPELRSWLERQGVDPTDPAAVRAIGDHLSTPKLNSIAVYTRQGYRLLNSIVTEVMLSRELPGWRGTEAQGLTEHRAEIALGNKADRTTMRYLDELAAGRRPDTLLPMRLRELVHVGEPGQDLGRSAPFSPFADRYVQASRAATEWNAQEQALRAAGDDAAADQVGMMARQAVLDQRLAWGQLKAQIDRAEPDLFDEMRWHADMLYDALHSLPAAGRPEAPLVVVRGNSRGPDEALAYGSEISEDGVMRQYISVTPDMRTAANYLNNRPPGHQKVLEVFVLTGHNAHDIAPFSDFPRQQELLFPPGSGVEVIDAPGLVDQIRAQLPVQLRDQVAIVVYGER
jgi:hypothetical protein